MEAAYAFPAVDAGNYELRAEKQVLRADHHQPCPADGSALCDNLVDVEPITVVAGQELVVNLVLEPEVAIPPPTLVVYPHRLEFSGRAHLHDDEVIGSENGHYDLDGFCEVSPFNRDQKVKIPAERLCTGGEVVLNLWAHCTLQEDNETIRLVLEAELREGSKCSTDDVEDVEATSPVDVPTCANPEDPSACLTTVSMELNNSGAGGGDYAKFDLHYRTCAWTHLYICPTCSRITSAGCRSRVRSSSPTTRFSAWNGRRSWSERSASWTRSTATKRSRGFNV